MSLCITLDRNVLDIMTKHTLKLDDVFIILCIHTQNHQLLKDYLRGKSVDQHIVVFQPLIRKQLVTNNGDHSIEHYVLTKEGLFIAVQLTASIGALSTQQSEPTAGKTDLDKLVEEYLELFPKGVKNGGNKPLRSNIKDTMAKMRRFQVKYGYNNETILKATKNYVDRLRGVYTYCPTAEYFIMKDGSSALATECQMIKDVGSDEDIINPFERRM